MTIEASDRSTGDSINEGSEAPLRSGGLLGWMEQNLHQVDLADVLRQYLQDFSSEALADTHQRALTEQKLSGLSPLVLHELHQNVIGRSITDRRLTPDEVVEKTWGTIRGTDQNVLREIIEDEEYCGY